MKKRLWKENAGELLGDLHDTVSQELFAANMILSGVASQDQVLQLPKVGQQLKGSYRNSKHCSKRFADSLITPAADRIRRSETW